MTKRQERAVEYLRREVLKHDGLDMPDRYEYKTFDVREMPSYRKTLVFVVTEVGAIGDEGTLAAIFCRTRRNIMIGPRGAMTLLNGQRKNVHGAEVTWALTE